MARFERDIEVMRLAARSALPPWLVDVKLDVFRSQRIARVGLEKPCAPVSINSDKMLGRDPRQDDTSHGEIDLREILDLQR